MFKIYAIFKMSLEKDYKNSLFFVYLLILDSD